MRNLRVSGKQSQIIEMNGRVYVRANGSLIEMPTKTFYTKDDPVEVKLTRTQRIIKAINDFIEKLLWGKN